MLYSIVLVSTVQWSESAIVCIYSLHLGSPFHHPPYPIPLSHHSALSWAHCALYQVPTTYLFSHMVVCISGFRGGSDGKESTCNAGDVGLIPRLGRSPGEGHGNPLQYSCLENPCGQRSLVGCSPWGCKELDTTEWLSMRARTHTHTQCIYVNPNLPVLPLPTPVSILYTCVSIPALEIGSYVPFF